jgi:hypothetical protein
VADTTTGVKNPASPAGSGPAGSRARDVAFRDRPPRWSVTPIAARRADERSAASQCQIALNDPHAFRERADEVIE